ncbi:MAG: efflux RND transporter periplasmic adaptor subunit [Pirellulales bacterium]
MTTATLERQQTEPGQPLLGAGLEPLRRLHGELLRKVSAAASRRELLAGLAELIVPCLPPVAMFYLGRNAQGELTEAMQLFPPNQNEATPRLARLVASACQTACRQGALEVRRQTLPPQTVIAAPVALQGSDPDAVGFVFGGDQPVQPAVMLAQIAADHLVLWHVLAATRETDHEAAASAAMVELVGKLSTAPDLRAACFALAAELQTHLKCQRVAVGLRPGSKGHCRLMALSGMAQFDPRSRTTLAIEAAFDETILRNDITHWPAAEEQSRHGALAHKHLCSLEDAKGVSSTPLYDAAGQAIGALLLFHDAAEHTPRLQRFLPAARQPIARALEAARRMEGGRLTRAGRTVTRGWRTWKAKAALAAAVLLAAGMAIPLPYRLHCDCQIEPVTRRFIAAPFEGTLDKSLAKPGDIVAAGTLLARMDGQEIRWKRASLAADQSQAAKKRDAAQAGHNYADMQIAALEVERLGLELKLLDHRAENLEIKSPVAGIVVSGDLDRAQGAPLTLGQTLFEIAPLEQMVVEVAIPDADVAFARAGQPLSVRLDAFPQDEWQATLAKVHPRSEIRDEANIFVAETELDNAAGRLSPGMKGRAIVETDRRAIAWILFHRPWEFVTKTLRW